MRKKLKKYYIGIIPIILIFFTSCNSLDQVPTGEFTDGTYWYSSDKASYVLNMAYNQMMNANYFFANEALTDNIFSCRTSDEKLISSGIANASTGRFANEWSDCYGGIRTCNTFLENVDRVANMDIGLKARMKAEARFIRASLFFRLTTWYGDIPLFNKNITVPESKTISRTSHADVLKFVRAELDSASEVLPASYAGSDIGRITSGAAISLKARTYLYENDWVNVASTCLQIIDSKEYSLFPDYAGLFSITNEHNSEVILDVEYLPTLRTWSQYYDFAPPSAGRRVNQQAPTQELVNSYLMMNGDSIHDSNSGYDENNPFVNRDPRFAATVLFDGGKWRMPNGTDITIKIKPGSGTIDEYKPGSGNNSLTGYYMKKYYDPTYTGSFNSGLDLILIRYADILLMYAEAENELGKMDQTIWDETIKQIRARAGFTDPNALNYNTNWNQSDLRTIIRNERRCELALEGTRIFDIRRWKTAQVVLNGYPHGAKYDSSSPDNGYIRLDKRSFNPGRDYLFAVPQAQKDLDPKLGQNPGY
ncbi:MAG: RagB/SusD family nutrient uptake outer membrane protein [Bacteroidota bacterium]|nr:RagB/SusD family nutrient uptake outer membrane protein [Bacteroidota bacterium]